MRYLAVAAVLTFGGVALATNIVMDNWDSPGSKGEGALIGRIVGRRDAFIVRASADGAKYLRQPSRNVSPSSITNADWAAIDTDEQN